MTRLTAITASLLISLPVFAQPLQIEYNGLRFNAELEYAGHDSLAGKTVVLINHGTLAHARMELISALQETLAEADIPSLAPTLSLGIDNRQGMYDCKTPHTHRHEDAVTELKLWLDWLKSRDVSQILLLGHSRGGNQVAQLTSTSPDYPLLGQVLLAPMTWNAEYEADAYTKRYGKPLAPLLADAVAQGSGPLPDPVDFIYCEKAPVNAESFVSYYADTPDKHTPFLMQNTELPTLVIMGSEDQVVPDLPQAMLGVGNPLVERVSIEGADHFFRDLYTYDVVDQITGFMDRQP